MSLPNEPEESKPHWYRDCLVVDTNDCDCFNNRELLEYPCNCKYCLEAAGYVVDVDL